MHKLSNYINDVLEFLNNDESGEVLHVDEVKQLLFGLVEKTNEGLYEIIDRAQDALTRLNEAEEIYEDNFSLYKTQAKEAAHLIENVALTEMVRVGVWFNNNGMGVKDDK